MAILCDGDPAAGKPLLDKAPEGHKEKHRHRRRLSVDGAIQASSGTERLTKLKSRSRSNDSNDWASNVSLTDSAAVEELRRLSIASFVSSAKKRLPLPADELDDRRTRLDPPQCLDPKLWRDTHLEVASEQEWRRDSLRNDGGCNDAAQLGAALAVSLDHMMVL